MSSAQPSTPKAQDLEKTSTVKQSALHFFLGIVHSVDTQSGILKMTRLGGAGGGKEPISVYMPLQDSLQGVGAYDIPIAGTTMLCVSLSAGTSDDGAYALLPVNYLLDAGYNSAAHRAPFVAGQQAPFSENTNSAAVNREHSVSPASNGLLFSHAHGMPHTAEAGDYYVMDKETGTGLMVGKLLAMLRGNSLSRVEVDAVNGRTVVSGQTVFLDSTTGEDAHCRGYYVRNTALNETESLGALNNQPILQIDETQKEGSQLSIALDAIPFFRLQHAEGAPVDGIQDMVIGNVDETVTAHLSNTEPTIMAVSKMGLSGEINSMSTKGLSFVKSPSLQGIHQIGYGNKPLVSNRPDDKLEFDDLREPYAQPTASQTKESNMSLDDSTVNAALIKMVDGLLEGQYSEAFKKIMADKGFGPSSTGAQLLKSKMSSESQQGVKEGATTQQFYELPDKIELEDPVTKVKHTYFDSTAFITQEPDGSICIGDGYGSELRMCRGNIYISPALDLVVQTGRDASIMAGRHQSYTSQATTTINSGDTTHIRAVKDLEMVGATGGTGIVTLTSESKNTSSMLDKPNGGILLGSTGDLAVIAGTNMYIGINKNIDNNENKAASDVAVSKTKGRMIVDAGDSLFVTGSSAQLSVDKAFTLLCDKNCFTVNQNDVSLVAAYTYVNSNIDVTPYRNPTVTVPDIHQTNVNKKEKKVETRKNDKLTVTLRGDTKVFGDLTVGQRLDGDERAKYDSNSDWPGKTEKGGNILCSGMCEVGSTLAAAAVKSAGPVATAKWICCSSMKVDADILVNGNCRVKNRLHAASMGASSMYMPANAHTYLAGTLTKGFKKEFSVTVGGKTGTVEVEINPGDLEFSVGTIDNSRYAPDLLNPVSKAVEDEDKLTAPDAKTAHYVSNNKPYVFVDKNPVVSDVLSKDQTVCNDRFIQARRFRFPSTFDVEMSYMPGMRWQSRASGETWKLNPVEYFDGASRKKSEGYPGWDILSNIDVTTLKNGTLAKVPFKTGYKTNYKKQTK